MPHFRSPGHPETETCERLAELYEAAGLPHRKLRDGQAIVVEGPAHRVVWTSWSRYTRSSTTTGIVRAVRVS